MNSLRQIVTLLVLVACCGATSRADDATDALLEEAAKAAQRGEHERAIAVLGDLIKQKPTTAIAYYLRGREHFRFR